MSKKRLALIGGGGFAWEVLEVARLCGYEVSDYYATGETDIRLAYRGYLDELVANRAGYDGVFLGLGALNLATLVKRGELCRLLAGEGFDVPVLVSPHAVVSEGARLGAGTFVAHGAVVSVEAQTGEHCLINTSAVVGHHTTIGSNSIISPRVFVGGNCTIEHDVLIGAGANILQKRTIGTGSLVGLGVDVYRDVKPHSTLWPARYQTTAN